MLSRRFLLNNTNLLYENTSKIILKNTKKDQVMSLILFVYQKLGDVILPLVLERYMFCRHGGGISDLRGGFWYICLS